MNRQKYTLSVLRKLYFWYNRPERRERMCGALTPFAPDRRYPFIVSPLSLFFFLSSPIYPAPAVTSSSPKANLIPLYCLLRLHFSRPRTHATHDGHVPTTASSPPPRLRPFPRKAGYCLRYQIESGGCLPPLSFRSRYRRYHSRN